ncbi:hypothetical protein B4099_0865 [Heyndrickxia coagulans]|uniref:Uncharacterized protein n=1 Tax=Heyndrickxia coagulans TaxID=1398 RepID=A0A150KFW6_HEYCO|nr:hypothetical protein B4099_0865 [Heyndrickxia coagulans]
MKTIGLSRESAAGHCRMMCEEVKCRLGGSHPEKCIPCSEGLRKWSSCRYVGKSVADATMNGRTGKWNGRQKGGACT